MNRLIGYAVIHRSDETHKVGKLLEVSPREAFFATAEFTHLVDRGCNGSSCLSIRSPQCSREIHFLFCHLCIQMVRRPHLTSWSWLEGVDDYTATRTQVCENVSPAPPQRGNWASELQSVGRDVQRPSNRSSHQINVAVRAQDPALASHRSCSIICSDIFCSIIPLEIPQILQNIVKINSLSYFL